MKVAPRIINTQHKRSSAPGGRRAGAALGGRGRGGQKAAAASEASPRPPARPGSSPSTDKRPRLPRTLNSSSGHRTVRGCAKRLRGPDQRRGKKLARVRHLAGLVLKAGSCRSGRKVPAGCDLPGRTGCGCVRAAAAPAPAFAAAPSRSPRGNSGPDLRSRARHK